MSTGLNCEFLEVEPGKWYYLLENGNAPKQCWDWHEYAMAYGPFTSQDSADDHLFRYHANPGGAVVSCYDPSRKLSEIVQKLLTKAPDNMQRWRQFG